MAQILHYKYINLEKFVNIYISDYQILSLLMALTHFLKSSIVNCTSIIANHVFEFASFLSMMKKGIDEIHPWVSDDAEHLNIYASLISCTYPYKFNS